ncbi:MAG: hypothetical protein ACLQVI_14250, partial [Polyangiaceae bacterium]
MSREQAILVKDLWRLADAKAPDLLEAILALIEQGEPPPEEPEPANAFRLEAFRAALKGAARQRDRVRGSAAAYEAWKRYLAQPEGSVLPQMKLAELVVALYDKKTGPARHALLTIARRGPLTYGIWGGLKRVYKR